jgi:hypothetical protein
MNYKIQKNLGIGRKNLPFSEWMVNILTQFACLIDIYSPIYLHH